MSLQVHFFLISKIKFEEYCQLADSIFPPARSKTIKKPQIRFVQATDKRMLHHVERSQRLRNFLCEFGEQPYTFKWNGRSLSDALWWLQQTKNIDLCQIQYADPSGIFWILLDESLKDRYVESIAPASIKTRDLADYVQRVIRDDGARSRNSAKDAALATQLSQAMMDGIKILHDYLRLVDSNSIVMLLCG